MKKRIYVLCFLALMAISASSSAQVYQTADDTLALNKEYTEVSNAVASLEAKLTAAQNNMPGYRSKAGKANADAQDAAINSSTQAGKAVDGGVKEARKAKRESRKAYREAKEARTATKKRSDQNAAIASLKGQLAKKQERLQQLEAMRTAINSAYPQL